MFFLFTLTHLSSCTVVDRAVQVIGEYHVKIHKFERDILLRPKMDTVRQREASVSFPLFATHRKYN